MQITQALTGGNGFYHSEGKETLWTERKLVIKDRQTGWLASICMWRQTLAQYICIFYCSKQL